MKSIIQLISLVIALASFCAEPISAGMVSSNESLNISIRGVPAQEQQRVSGPYNVSDKGYIYMPLLKGGIRAKGLTTSALARRIEAAYKKAGMYQNPRITVISQQDDKDRITQQQKVVNVGGHVRASGAKPYLQGMTLFSAISAAGGPDKFGAMNRVEVFRNGKRKVYNLKKSSNMSVKVYPGDIINVPQKNWHE